MDENNILRQQTNRLQHEKETCQSRIASLEADISDLMKKKQFSSVEISDYFRNQKIISDLQNKLQRVEGESSSTLASQNYSMYSSIASDNLCHSITEPNNKYSLDTTQKEIEKQKLLSDTMLENASLKKSISITEAENAKLTAQLQKAKWKLTNLSPSSRPTKMSNSFNDCCSAEDFQQQIAEKNEQIKVAHQTISKLKNALSETQIELQKNSFLNMSSKSKQLSMSDYSREIENHKKELKRAQIEIRRLTEKNNESDKKIASFEKTLREREREYTGFIEESTRSQIMSQSNIDNFGKKSDADICQQSFSWSNTDINMRDKQLQSDLGNIKAICTSLKDENASLKAEINHLRNKANDYKEAYEKELKKKLNPSVLRDEALKLRNEMKYIKGTVYDQQSSCYESSNSTNTFSRSYTQTCQSTENIPNFTAFRKLLLRYSSDLSLKFNFFQTKMTTEMDKLELKLERFQTYWNQVVLLQKRYNNHLFKPQYCSAEKFIKMIQREVRIIKTLSQVYSQTHNIPKNLVPPPSALIADPEVLKEFVYKNLSPIQATHERKSISHKPSRK